MGCLCMCMVVSEINVGYLPISLFPLDFKGQRLLLGIFLDCFPPYFEGQDLSLNLELSFK